MTFPDTVINRDGGELPGVREQSADGDATSQKGTNQVLDDSQRRAYHGLWVASSL